MIKNLGLNSAWKAPVAYFLTRGMQATTLKELVMHALDALKDCGIEILVITMDGHATNMSLARLLGADMTSADSFRPYFMYDDHKVSILLDPCHMVKLVRNFLQAYGSIKSNSGTIKWKYIERLNTIQDDMGLRLGNRLTSRHVNFQHNKMKVREDT